MMRRPGQRRRRDEEKALGIGHRLIGFELIRRDKGNDWMVLLRRLQILPDREEIDISRTQIVH